MEELLNSILINIDEKKVPISYFEQNELIQKRMKELLEIYMPEITKKITEIISFIKELCRTSRYYKFLEEEQIISMFIVCFYEKAANTAIEIAFTENKMNLDVIISELISEDNLKAAIDGDCMIIAFHKLFATYLPNKIATAFYDTILYKVEEKFLGKPLY